VSTRVTDLRNVQGDYRSLDDRMLVLDFQAGHPEAFVEIHRRYGQLARHVCRRLLPNRADADEAFQEAMIRVFQGLHRFNGRYALQPWIARIATNVSLDQIRARSRRPQVDDGAFEEDERRDPAEGPEEAFERLVERDLVLSVLSGLPASHRTALVLRELEGRSHKEIAESLGITPSQAKALIHRAKGSFRRGWLKAMAERGGLAGIAVLPLLWVARLGDHGRRLVDRVGGHASQVAQAATPEVVHTAASSPAMATAATGVTERVVAAGMTLLLAGGVTVGAATIVRRDHDRQATDRTAAAPVVREPQSVAPAGEAPDVPVGDPEEPAKVKASARKNDEPKGQAPVVVEPPAEEPSPSPSQEPEPSPTPSPEPTQPPVVGPPPVPPAPAWSYSFTSSTESVETCDCAGTRLVTSHVSRREDGRVAFSTFVKGGALDAVGDPTWPFWLLQEGKVEGSLGTLAFRFGLSSSAGTFLYGGEAALAEAVEREDGSTSYTFAGTFDLLNPQQPVAGLPWRGTLTATVDVWVNGTIYGGSFFLSDAGV
jgi:RNA polymerase sigma-70 factor (ECF subfamily)